ncbi:hypothetical protein CYLTODRAFT_426736 [Cylindrobasidium torrendii FP15055 ss-10]|uniref:Zn(2)-C6 fungal-type domain-containing protein n=1 Tax=Cylindrobasidium torrendii FP15055 ss-10 TaxID=1314674 RepID=A0A0D7AZE9_9AGAR|nr:hypothetical protein CYLTODRAFT_426736 [Cylindrobasidium torrendii FP15055 ss-10]
MVAGCRGGKTSFLRLFLDTCSIAPNTASEDLASVAKFVQGCSARTWEIRQAAVDVEVPAEDPRQRPQRVGLTLIDTPAIDYADDHSVSRVVGQITGLVEARYAEATEDPRLMLAGDPFVHLCLYFLDPDLIVPPHLPPPPVPPPAARGRGNSQSSHEPVILEPPLTRGPGFTRAMLHPDDIKAIRLLCTKVNVLPVIAKADTMTNDRLNAVKVAVRHDLAQAGIGFGIFDEVLPTQTPNGYRNGSSSSGSPPSTPVTHSLVVPHALISPDMYSYDDGVTRPAPSRQQLVNQYTPSAAYAHAPSKLVPGTFVRSYRWGFLDVLDPAHCDFMPLRTAIFHHMNTLRNYTKDFLFGRFQTEHADRLQRRGPPPLLPTISRPTLSIDTARHQPLPLPKGNDPRPISMSNGTRPVPEAPPVAGGSHSAHKDARQRSKKITVACNFCRSRKLKCDGGRPACSQCVKRQNACQYSLYNKRRGAGREGSGSDSGEDTPASDPPPLSRPMTDRRPSVSDSRMTPMPIPPPLERPRSLFHDNELPALTMSTFPDRERERMPPMSAPPIPPMVRSPPDTQSVGSISAAASPSVSVQPARKRAMTAPGAGAGKKPSASGPKIVACNFCRARKTKCDGGHPACSSCMRRNMACNYVNERLPDEAVKKAKRLSTSSSRQSPPSPQSSRMVPTPISGNDGDDYFRVDEEQDMKRQPLGSPMDMRPLKKMRMDGEMYMDMRRGGDKDD